MKFTLNNINKPYYYIMMCTINFVNFFHLFFISLQWNENDSNEDNFQCDRRPRDCESTVDKKKLWPFAIVDMCAQVLISWFLLRPESLQFVIKKTHIILHCLFLFLKVFIYCTFCLQNVWLFLQYDSLMPSNLYLAINT